MIGEYFADYDEKTGLFCVFHTDKRSGHAYSTWATMKQAEYDARRRNDEEKASVRLATFLRMEGYFYVFEDATGEVHFIRPQEVSNDVKAGCMTPGIEVTLEYRTTPTSGLWYVK